MQNLKSIVNANLCLGCGLCTINIEHEDQIEMIYSKKRGLRIPKVDNFNSVNVQNAYNLCPGKGYRIFSLAIIYKLGDKYKEEIGFYDNVSVITSNNEDILKNASSSGIMTSIIEYLISNNYVDEAIVTKYEYTKNGIFSSPIITNNKNDLIEAQGSKYCPVDFSSVLKQIKESNYSKTYVFVGTPCQIAGLRYIQENIKNLGIKYYIGNFCGGFKSYNNLNRIIKLNNIKPEKVSYFRFRGGGQPGSMLIKTSKKKIEIPYPRYVEMTGYSKVKRCHFCVDATAELADFSCGDAWLQKYIDTKIPTSIVITRNKFATDILSKLYETKEICINTISVDDVIKSQIGNIITKKFRQFDRIRLYKMLGFIIPELKEGFLKRSYNNLNFEINVFLSHRIKFVFEKLHLFPFFYYKNSFLKKVMFRLFRDNYN